MSSEIRMAFPALVRKRTHCNPVTHKATHCLECTASIVRLSAQTEAHLVLLMHRTQWSLIKASNFRWPHLHALSGHMAHVCEIDATLQPIPTGSPALNKTLLLPTPLPKESSKKGWVFHLNVYSPGAAEKGHPPSSYFDSLPHPSSPAGPGKSISGRALLIFVYLLVWKAYASCLHFTWLEVGGETEGERGSWSS